jgi:hypothetical protein
MQYKKYFIYFLLFSFLYILILYISGFFNIGMLSDSYMDTYSSVNSTISQKLTSAIPFKDNSRFRPLEYLMLQGLANFKVLFGISYDNFIVYNITNLFLLISIAFILGLIIFKRSQKNISALLPVVFLFLFPNTIHNICWTSAIVDLLCSLFCVLSLYFLIDYFEEKKFYKAVISILFLLLSLFTKESAIMLLPVEFLILYSFFGNKSFLKLKFVYLSGILILIFYFLYRVFVINSFFNTYSQTILNSNIIKEITLKTLISIFIPLDYLSLNNLLKNYNFQLIIYLLALISLSVSIFLIIIKGKSFKSFFFILFFFIVTTSLYYVVGYVRPQMMFFPFVFILIIIFSNLKKFNYSSFKLLKRIIYVLLIFIFFNWTIWSFKVIEDWKEVYKITTINITNLSRMDINKDKCNLILASPSRIKQSFMLENVSGAYNFWKYHNHLMKDTLINVLNTAALDKNSLTSKLEVSKLNLNSYEIKAKGETQFFEIQGYKLENYLDKSFDTKQIKIYPVNVNYFGKVNQVKVEIVNGCEVYLYDSLNYIRLN